MPTVLVIDDNPAVATALEVLFSLHELRTLGARLARRGARAARARAGRRRDPGHELPRRHDVGRGGRRAVPRDPRALPRPAGDPADRVDAARDRGRARQGRRRRLPRQAVGRHASCSPRCRTCSSSAEAQPRAVAPRAAREPPRAASSSSAYDLRGLVFADPAMERVVALACQVARADVPVLITGPNGAGKEKHRRDRAGELGGASDGPFVTLNCGALPAELIEAELFGAEAGAYTGANQRARGQVRGGRRRHAVPRRDRQPVADRPDEAAARARDRPVRAARLQQGAPGQGARDQRDQRRPRRR